MLRKRIKRKRFNPRNPSGVHVGTALLFSTLFFTGQAEETAPAPVPSPPTAPPPASYGTGTSQLSPFGSAFSESPLALSSLFRWGPVHLRPRVTYRYSISDGLQAEAGQESKTEIHEIIPVFHFQLGDLWSLTYTPAFRFYSDSAFEDSLDHSLLLAGATVYESWSLGFSQGYSFSSTPLVETGAQTKQETFSTSLSASYQLNSKVSFDLGLNQNLRFIKESGAASSTGTVGDSREWSTTDWVNYQLFPKLRVGAGVGFGYSDNESATTYEQINGRIDWKVAQKLNLGLTAGFEQRQFLDSDQPDLFNPIFSASIAYQIFEPTSLSLTASRSVNTSYYENLVTENTSVNVGLSQRLFGRFNLGLSAGIGSSDYKGAASGVNPTRQDDTSHYSASLSTSFWKRATASVFYSVSENSSGQSDVDYSSKQIGGEVSYQF